MRYHEIMTEATKPPKPDDKHLLDAIDHADNWQEGWTLKDFTLRYEGYLTVDDIGEFDDTYGWLEAHEPDDLRSFRQGSFAGEPREMPPIVLITAPDEDPDDPGGDRIRCHTQVGDGRGRVNFANVHGLRLHVWHLIHKKCDASSGPACTKTATTADLCALDGENLS